MSQQVQSSQMLAHAPPTSSVPPNSIPVSSVSVSANANSVAIQQQQLLMNRVQESNKAQANLEKQRVALLLEINAELLRECIDQSKNVKAPSEGERPPDSGTTGIMKRLQANLAYLAALADRSNKGGVAPMPQIPNILSPPSDMPHLEDRYKKLQELFANMKTVNSPLHPPPHTPQQVAMQRPRAPSQSKPAMNPQVVPQSPMAAPPPQSSPPPPQQMPVTQTRQPAIHQPQMMVDPNTGMPAHPQMAGPHGMPNVNPQMMAAQNMAMHQNMMIQQQRAAQAQRQQQLQQAQAHAQRMQQQQMMAGGMAGVPGPQGVPMQGMGVQVPQGMPMGMGMQGVPGGMMPQQQPGIGQGMYMDPNQANMWNGMM